MGLLSWLFRKPAFDLQPDRIFLTRLPMLGDFTRQCRTALESHDRVLLVTHFEESRQAVLDQLKAGRVPCHSDADRLRSHAVRAQLHHTLPTLVLAEQLIVEETAIESHDRSLSIAVLVAEHHPLRRHDLHIEQFLASVPATTRLTYFGSLDSAVYRRFAEPWVIDVLKKMGMKADEVLESQLVSRRLIAAQRRLETAIVSDIPADSADEWCERNLPKS